MWHIPRPTLTLTRDNTQKTFTTLGISVGDLRPHRADTPQLLLRLRRRQRNCNSHAYCWLPLRRAHTPTTYFHAQSDTDAGSGPQRPVPLAAPAQVGSRWPIAAALPTLDQGGSAKLKLNCSGRLPRDIRPGGGRACHAEARGRRVACGFIGLQPRTLSGLPLQNGTKMVAAGTAAATEQSECSPL
jgi:hypothetical protein